tara:strand:- start:12926 stop:13123 length:198 start_codon:yes stop_codon:yes gene_type:complete
MNYLINLCHRDHDVSQQIVDDIDDGRARHFERIGYGPRVEVTDNARARELVCIAGIDAFLASVAE